MRLIPYLRVSSMHQAEEGMGLETQRLTIEKAATTALHQLLPPVTDAGVSGATELENRPGLAKVLAMLKDNEADGLIVYRLDRLARDLIVQEQILSEVWRSGGEVLSCDAGEQSLLVSDSSADPSRTLVRQILGAVAQYERALIKLRMSAGRQRKRERGGYAGGRPGYGTKALDKELVPDEVERKALVLIGRLRKRGLSLNAICAELTRMGVEPPGGGDGLWYATTVRRLLRDSTR